LGMKTAVSIPDELFRRAEAAAKRKRVSRSRLYATALSEFLGREQRQAITDRLNDVYSRQPSKLNPALKQAQFRSLERESW